MNKYLTTTFTLPNGKRKYIRAKTKTELEQKLQAAKAESHMGVDISDTTTVAEYLELWLRLTKEGRVAPNSLQNYRCYAENRIVPLIGSMRVRDVRASHILHVMRECGSLARGTQSIVLGILRGMFDAAVDDNLILRSPVPRSLRPGGAKTEETEALTDEQVHELLESTRDLSVWPILYAITQTGMRRSEVTGLLWSDVDTEHLVIHIRRHAVTDHTTGGVELEAGAKTEAGKRDIPVTRAFADWLDERRRGAKSVVVFPNTKGGVYSAAALTAVFGVAKKRVDFPVHLHQLRHTYATQLFEAGLDIKEAQRILGHADPGVTLRTYTHYRESERSESTAQKVREAIEATV